MNMQVSQDGRYVLEYFEGRCNESYPDPATHGDPWTIGVGHTGPEVCKGLLWADELIDKTLSADLLRFESAVVAMVDGREVTQGQFDALVLFAFNVGPANLAGSTLMRKFKAGDVGGAAAEFSRWDKANGQSMRGLRKRRVAERELFNGATGATAVKVAQMVP